MVLSQQFRLAAAELGAAGPMSKPVAGTSPVDLLCTIAGAVPGLVYEYILLVGG